MSNKALEKLQRSGEIESLLPDNDRYTNRFNIKSESSNRLYVVAQNKANGQWSCSCMGWIRYRKCKHLGTLQPLLTDVSGSMSSNNSSPKKKVKRIAAPAAKSSRKTAVEKEEEIPDIPDMEIETDPFADKKEKWVKILDGRQYGKEISKKEEKEAKKDGIVIVFGYSDDIIEFRGAINSEMHAGDILIDAKGVLPEREDIDDDDELRDYFSRDNKAKKIEAIWGGKKASWTYKTKIPHSTFKIYEDEELFCIGIIFELRDLK